MKEEKEALMGLLLFMLIFLGLPIGLLLISYLSK